MDKDQNTKSENLTNKEDNKNNTPENIDQKKPETKLSPEEKVKELEVYKKIINEFSDAKLIDIEE